MLEQFWALAYWQRLAILASLFVCIALLEWIFKKEQAKRWREYLFLFSVSALFAIFGAPHDLLTSALSPEYYALGKALGYQDLHINSAALGLKTGSFAGLIWASAFLFLIKSTRPRHFYLALLFTFIGAAFFVLLCLLLAFISRHYWLAQMPALAESLAFGLVWTWHLGLYLGACLGLGAYIWVYKQSSQKANRA